MGNTNQSLPSGGNLNQHGNAPGSVPTERRRRGSAVEGGPVEVPVAAHRYNVEGDTTPPSSFTNFSANLVKSLQAEDDGMAAADTYYRRFRAGSLSMDTAPPQNFVAVPAKLPSVIKWDKGGKEVFISGSFNNWEKIPLVKSVSNFYTIVDLPEGEHTYKFYVDGQWVHNPDEPTQANTQGTLNNVITVKRGDFEILDALETDSESVHRKEKEAHIGVENLRKLLTFGTDNGDDSFPQEEYGTEVPVRKPADRHTGPPILPPHLLQVILNKDIPEHIDPGLLPEPNHVMLNHLYALSIKDGVMVLSDTTRYKKKYVTSLLYKPIDS